MHYTTKISDGPNRADINYSCPCGCTAGILYEKELGPVELGDCCCGRLLSAGPEADDRVRSHLKPDTEYEIDRGTVTLPWGETVLMVLAVPKETLEADGVGGQTHCDDLAAMVKDVVCGMTIDRLTAAATSEYKGTTYYFCAQVCKTGFDTDPGRYIRSLGRKDDKRNRRPSTSKQFRKTGRPAPSSLH